MTPLANYDYIAVRHFVEFIQVLELQSSGINGLRVRCLLLAS